jgi:hypothetical protein
LTDCKTLTESTILDFDEFCEKNAMTNIDKEKFKSFLEKEKLEVSEKRLSRWLALFNKFFDQLY